MLTDKQEKKFQQRKSDWRTKWDAVSFENHPQFAFILNITAKRILILLEDYAGRNASNIPASIVLFFKGHPNRRYVERVSNYLTTSYPNTHGHIMSPDSVAQRRGTTPTTVLTGLKEIIGEDVVAYGDLNALFEVIKEKKIVDYHALEVKRKTVITNSSF